MEAQAQAQLWQIGQQLADVLARPGALLAVGAAALALVCAGFALGWVALRAGASRTRESFRSLAADALHANIDTFLALAGERFQRLEETSESDWGTRRKALDETVAPLRDALDRYRVEAHELERTRAQRTGELGKEGRDLTAPTSRPNDAPSASAASRDRALIDHALGKGVVIATPATLYALLGAIARGWRDARVEENTREVLRHARVLDERLALFVEHLAKVGANLGRSVEAYNGAIGSLETRVLPQARRMRELGAEGPRALPGPEPIALAVRVPTVP